MNASSMMELECIESWGLSIFMIAFRNELAKLPVLNFKNFVGKFAWKTLSKYSFSLGNYVVATWVLNLRFCLKLFEIFDSLSFQNKAAIITNLHRNSYVICSLPSLFKIIVINLRDFQLLLQFQFQENVTNRRIFN